MSGLQESSALGFLLVFLLFKSMPKIFAYKIKGEYK